MERLGRGGIDEAREHSWRLVWPDGAWAEGKDGGPAVALGAPQILGANRRSPTARPRWPDPPA